MNVKELNKNVKENKKRKLEETIKEIERYILWRGNNGFNDFEVSTNRSSIITIKEWMIEPLKEYFENNGYKVEIEEMKTPIKKCIGNLLKTYEPQYLMVISW